ncbi:MAG: glutamate racemase [Firmicutes bacterium]|nr:glutamate racemase [Bacillota bacterium]
MNDTRPIGIFDSGVGGLTVAKEIRRILPNESTIYVGDTARAPYGSKTPDQLLFCAREIINFLLSKNVKAVVIACGTSSAVTYETLLQDFPDLPLMDVIRPGIDECAKLIYAKQDILPGVIATTATINSNVFPRLLWSKAPGARIRAVACPLFASMIEAGLPANHPAVNFAVETYLSHLRGKINALVLGCTHYPIIKSAITAYLGRRVRIINIGEATARAAKKQLAQLGILAGRNTPATHEFYVTGPGDVFRTTGKLILGEECEPETGLQIITP